MNMTEIASATLGALLGGLAGLLASLWTARQSQRAALTQSLLAEFLSASFLQHRISMEGTWRRLMAGSVTASALAGGFWYPGDPNYYSGETLGSLNEHQHLEAYIGFILKVDHAVTRKQADRSDLALALSGGMVWHRYLVMEVADETTRQANAAGVPVPPWASAARRVFDRLGVPQQAPLESRPPEVDIDTLRGERN
jgi:hypothetical protein